MFKNINGLSVFLTILIAWLGYTFYSVIEEQERPQYKVEVSRLIRADFFKHKTEFRQLATFASEVKSYSKEWYFEKKSGTALSYFSRTPFDSCKISTEEYIKKYFGSLDIETDPRKVPDFKVFPGLAVMLDTLNMGQLRFEKDEFCSKRSIAIVYANTVFSPEGRTVIFRYFPEGMCMEMIAAIKNSDNKWNWSFFLDKNWIAQSVKKQVQY